MASSGGGASNNPHPEPPGKVHTTDRLRPYKQDLPPKGGYAPINFKRIPARSIVNAPILFGAFIVTQTIGLYQYTKMHSLLRREKIEVASTERALEPLMMAERDREFLRQLRKNRDYEAELMADVPGWEVGTWFGQPLYRAQEDDVTLLRSVTWNDFFLFSSPDHRRSEQYYRDNLVI